MEKPLQKHLEEHPWLLTGHHSPEDDLVISQLDMGGKYRTDFAYFWQQSGGDFLQLIEIERAAIPSLLKKMNFGVILIMPYNKSAIGRTGLPATRKK